VGVRENVAGRSARSRYRERDLGAMLDPLILGYPLPKRAPDFGSHGGAVKKELGWERSEGDRMKLPPPVAPAGSDV
jgi:hypothetical protein